MRRVLLVDDDDDSRELLQELFRAHGYEVQSASNGIAALEIAASFRPEVTVLDIRLPDMDGYELAHKLRQVEGLERIRLVALTGYDGEHARERSREAGIDEHLVKPITMASLTALFDRVTGGN